ncbi:hypothetical protein MNBD_GAMMA22-311 [hydrothermal vent metagenome]|uniref:Uncharacterized protein n=1 Tax=hydrothermal vent metagenome TaxID=652676 RepID=A0A3B0ZXV0_9ZZZZ
MNSKLFNKITQQIANDPKSGQSLLIFALIKTLDTPKGGHLYLLKKLSEFTPESREIAYALMEVSAKGENQGDEWDSMVSSIESAFHQYQ